MSRRRLVDCDFCNGSGHWRHSHARRIVRRSAFPTGRFSRRGWRRALRAAACRAGGLVVETKHPRLVPIFCAGQGPLAGSLPVCAMDRVRSLRSAPVAWRRPRLRCAAGLSRTSTSLQRDQLLGLVLTTLRRRGRVSPEAVPTDVLGVVRCDLGPVLNEVSSWSR